jgi:hypothetical protein
MRRVLKQRQRSSRKRDRNLDPSASETKPRLQFHELSALLARIDELIE